MVRSWEAPCRPGAEGWRSRTGSCALAVPDALAVRHSNPNCYRPRWVKQVSPDKASPPTHCVNLVSRNRGSPDRFESDWMPDTVRSLRYPSDSMRAARERDPGDILHPPRAPAAWLSALADRFSHTWPASAFSLPATGLGRSAGGRSPSRRIKPGPSVAAVAIGAQREAGLGRRGPRVATGAPCILSHLAGVGGQPLANGYGRTARAARGRARSNQATSSLPLSSACSGGASLGWHGQRVVIPARRDLGGSGAVAPSFARAWSAGPPPEWRIASVMRLRRSRGRRTERGSTAGRHFCGSALGPAGSLPEPGLLGPVKFDYLTSRVPRRADPGPTTLIPRPVARSRPAGGVRVGSPPAGATGCHGPDSDAGRTGSGHPAMMPGDQVPRAGRSVITGPANSGHGLGPCSRGLCPSDASRAAGLDHSR